MHPVIGLTYEELPQPSSGQGGGSSRFSRFFLVETRVGEFGLFLWQAEKRSEISSSDALLRQVQFQIERYLVGRCILRDPVFFLQKIGHAKLPIADRRTEASSRLAHSFPGLILFQYLFLRTTNSVNGSTGNPE